MIDMTDSRPHTVVLHQFTGIGDLIWHVQYFKAVAAQSRGGKVTVIAQPSTMARAILGHEPWVETVIDHDHRPRRGEGRKATHGGLLGMWKFARELKSGGYDRIILFSGRPSRGLLAALSGIPERLGYGYSLIQRMFLTRGPFIKRYKGGAVGVLKETSAFAIAQGFCEQPLVPRIDIPESTLLEIKDRLQCLRRPAVALAIGTSEPHKQWGASKFALLAARLVASNHGVVLLGGRAERELAAEILAGLPEEARAAVEVLTNVSIMGSAAAISLCEFCVGNDTGMVNVAAAVERRTYVLLGARPILDHDPLITSLRAASLDAITVDDVIRALFPRPAQTT